MSVTNTKNSQSLTTGQWVGYLVAGALFWFVAAMLVKFSGPYLLTEGNLGVYLLYALTVPLTLGFLYVLKLLIPYGRDQIHYVVGTVIYSATTLDGIAMTWFSDLYGQDVIVRHYGAGLILWGVAVGMVIGHIRINALLPLSGRLTRKDQVVYTVISALIWLSGVVVVRLLDPAIFQKDNTAFVIALLVAVVANFLMVIGFKAIVKPNARGVLNAIMWLSAPACLLDAISYAAWPHLYADQYAHSAIVGAYLLWFFGWGIAAAHLVERRAVKP